MEIMQQKKISKTNGLIWVLYGNRFVLQGPLFASLSWTQAMSDGGSDGSKFFRFLLKETKTFAECDRSLDGRKQKSQITRSWKERDIGHGA